MRARRSFISISLPPPTLKTAVRPFNMRIRSSKFFQIVPLPGGGAFAGFHGASPVGLEFQSVEDILHGLRIAFGADDQRSLGAYDDFAHLPRIGQRHSFQRIALNFQTGAPSGQNRQIAQPVEAAIPVAGRLDRHRLEIAAHMVQRQRLKPQGANQFAPTRERPMRLRLSRLSPDWRTRSRRA